jgi:hypothetical protein
MDWQYKLVETYVFICHRFEVELCAHAARFSNNHKPIISDEELVTIYLFGIMQGHVKLKAIHNYTRDHLSAWFPHLPSYQTFVRRLARLGNVFMHLSSQILSQSNCSDRSTALVDSFPVIMAHGSRGDRARVAPELADKGHCASKKLYFYGAKVHVLALRRAGTLPLPQAIGLSKASEHDLTIVRPLLPQLSHCRLFGDKIYFDNSLKEQLRVEQAVEWHTPIRRKKGQAFLRSDHQYYSTLVSQVRQPIESLFNWIQQKTDIENASKVRSAQGLILHVFGRIAAAMLMLVFYC